MTTSTDIAQQEQIELIIKCLWASRHNNEFCFSANAREMIAKLLSSTPIEQKKDGIGCSRVIPSKEEYEYAVNIVKAYNIEQERLYKKKVEAFEEDLKEYFATNLIDGRIELKKFRLEVRGVDKSGIIVPKEPCLEEDYDGGNDADIQGLCEKHGVHFSIVYWCYHK